MLAESIENASGGQASLDAEHRVIVSRTAASLRLGEDVLAEWSFPADVWNARARSQRLSRGLGTAAGVLVFAFIMGAFVPWLAWTLVAVAPLLGYFDAPKVNLTSGPGPVVVRVGRELALLGYDVIGWLPAARLKSLSVKASVHDRRRELRIKVKLSQTRLERSRHSRRPHEVRTSRGFTVTVPVAPGSLDAARRAAQIIEAHMQQLPKGVDVRPVA